MVVPGTYRRGGLLLPAGVVVHLYLPTCVPPARWQGISLSGSNQPQGLFSAVPFCAAFLHLSLALFSGPSETHGLPFFSVPFFSPPFSVSRSAPFPPLSTGAALISHFLCSYLPLAAPLSG